MIAPPPWLDAGPYRIRVSFDRAEFSALRKDNPDAAHWSACFDPVRGRILVDADFCLPEQAVSLWHECKHVAFRVAGGLPALGPKSTEDDVIETQEAAELDLLRRNPQLVAFITQDYDHAVSE